MRNIYRTSKFKMLLEILFTKNVAFLIIKRVPTEKDTITIGNMVAEFKEIA